MWLAVTQFHKNYLQIFTFQEAISRVQNENIRQIVILIASSDSYPLFFYYNMFRKEEIRSQRNIDLAHLPKLGLHRIKENYNVSFASNFTEFTILYFYSLDYLHDKLVV